MRYSIKKEYPMLASKKSSQFGKMTHARDKKIPMYSDVRTVVDNIGRFALADAVGAHRGAIDVAVHRGYLPAVWYVVVTEMAQEKGFAVSPDVFNFLKYKK